ncbi:hypothetical protein M513_11916 [Trichuris suis]|uniref:Reverse transcriptase domain-containing protein n=1 Tax=Trichuris suis TaxID=68888 RepID=A0A085LQG3_9BILA|nr:hypothetical protein M513_11916 [Trichuris suis]
MGSPLSPVLAEVFMEHLEEKAFTSISTSDAPIFFKRYVDDIFAITTVGKEETFLEHLNSLYPTKIKLTMEKEVDNKLPFLDVLVIKQGNNLKTTVYRKPTHSDRYLHFTSHHPMAVKRGIVKGMVDRAHAICDPTFLQSELKHITHTLTANGFQDSFFSQQDGAPMGSPLSPVLAEVFMEHLEEKAFTSISTSDAPIFFKRYVNDIFAISTVGKKKPS